MKGVVLKEIEISLINLALDSTVIGPSVRLMFKTAFILSAEDCMVNNIAFPSRRLLYSYRRMASDAPS